MSTDLLFCDSLPVDIKPKEKKKKKEKKGIIIITTTIITIK